MKKAVRAGMFAMLVLPGIALAQATTPKTFGDLANDIVQILNSGTTDLIVLAIVVYFWGVSVNLFKQGEKGHGELRKQLIWGVLVIFVAVSIWGIVQLLQTSIFGSSINGSGGSSSTNGQTCSSLTGCQLQ